MTYEHCHSLLFGAVVGWAGFRDSYSAHIKYVIKEAEASSARMERYPRQQPGLADEQHRHQQIPRHTVQTALLSRFRAQRVQKDEGEAEHAQLDWQLGHRVADQEVNRAGWGTAAGVREEGEGADEGAVVEAVADPAVGSHKAERRGHQGAGQRDRAPQEER